MSNLLLIIIVILNIHPFTPDALIEKVENIYIDKYINVQTESGEKGSVDFGIISKTPTKDTDTNIALTPKSYVSYDLNSWTKLEDKNADKNYQIASLTKLMTAYVVLKEMNLDHSIIVPQLDTQIGDSVVGLQTGQKLTVSEALEGLLVKSGSDSALTLAVANAGSVDSFVVKMNNAANELGLKNTHYSNPVGWDDLDNFSSANDVATLSRILLRNEVFASIVKQKSAIIDIQNGNDIHIENTNLLLNDNYQGVKTGYTYAANGCFAGLYKKDEKEILTVVIGADDRFLETTKIIDWISNHFSW